MRSTRGNPKTNPPIPTSPLFSMKVSKSKEIEALNHEYLTLEEGANAEDNGITEDPIE